MAQTDNFNRADENPLAAPWGAWAGFARPQLLTNQVARLVSGTFYASRTTVIGWTADHYSQLNAIQVQNGLVTQGDLVGVLVRASGNAGAHNGYFFYVQRDPGPVYNLYLTKYVSGTGTQLATTAYGGEFPVVNDILYLEAVGTSLVGKLNGVTKITATDSAVAGPGAPGFGFTFTGDPAHTVDDWEGADIAGTPFDASQMPHILMPTLLAHWRKYEIVSYGNASS